MALLLFAFDGEKSTAGPEADTADATGLTFDLLSTSNRSRLSVCVDGAGGVAVSASNTAVVGQALAAGLASAADTAAALRPIADGAATTSGCPEPTAALTADELDEAARNQVPRFGDLVGFPERIRDSEPSEHRVFVYFVPPSVFLTAFGSKSYAEGAAEMFCTGDVCAEVTTATYVPSSVSSDIVVEALLDALGLLPSEIAGDAPLSPEERRRKTRQALEDAEVAPSDIEQFFKAACESAPEMCGTQP